MRKYCLLRNDAQSILENAINRLGLSARAYDRVLKVSQTFTDTDAADRRGWFISLNPSNSRLSASKYF